MLLQNPLREFVIQVGIVELVPRSLWHYLVTREADSFLAELTRMRQLVVFLRRLKPQLSC